MERLVLLVIAVLSAALAMTLGLWCWRRLSRTASLKVPSRAGGGGDGVDKEAVHTGPRVRSKLGSSGGAATTSSTALNGPRAANPNHALAEEEKPEQTEVTQEAPEPFEPRVPFPPPSHPPVADVTAGAGPVHDGSQLDSAESGPPLANERELVPDTPDQDAALETAGDTLLAGAAADHDGAAPSLVPNDAIEKPGDTTPAAEESAGDQQEEDIPNDASGAEQPGAAPGTESDTGECGATVLPVCAAEELASEGTFHAEPESDSAPERDPMPEPPAAPAVRPRRPATHRDRRGKRRKVAAAEALSEPISDAPGLPVRLPAEAKLRLSLHPVRRAVRISVVLTRPDGFPERVTLQGDAEHAVGAYDTQRYDDLDLPWTGDLLDSELRLCSTDGFQWVRSARQIHIFAADPNEPDLISVGAARPGVAHALVCRSTDAADVHSASASAGSPELRTHEHWQGIPDGWIVLSGYTPTHAATHSVPAGLRPLDPGAGLEILFEGGLAIRPRVYAAGHPPRITIRPAPGGASITVGGEPATLSADGAWEAPGWDVPGQHMVDVVPGPSASYEIAADPWVMAGWDFWDAHSGRFENQSPRPWTRAEICGSQIRGPVGEAVFAAETQPTLIMMGLRSGAALLQRRGDVSVSIGFMAEAPAFLLAATGRRRTQGRLFWLGLTPASQASKRPDPDWVAVVRMAASRRLPLDRSDALGEDAWRKAKERARRLKKPRG